MQHYYDTYKADWDLSFLALAVNSDRWNYVEKDQLLCVELDRTNSKEDEGGIKIKQRK